MFNLFFRPYVPELRVRPLDDVPGFNVDENGLPRRANAWSGGTLPDAVTQRYPDAAQAETSYSIGFPTPLPGVRQPAPLIGLGGFRIDPQDDVPGFNVRPWDGVLGFNLNEGGILSLPPDPEDAGQPAPPQLPEWLYKVATVLPRLLTALDPLTGRRDAVDLPPGLPSTEAPVAKQWLSYVPQQSTDTNIRSRAAATQNTDRQPAGQGAMPSAWPQLRNDGWPYAQSVRLHDPWSTEVTRQPIGFPPILAARPIARFDFIPTNATGASKQPAHQQTPLQQYQQIQSSAPLGTGLAMVRLPEKASMQTASLERAPEQESSGLTEAYRPKEAESSPDNLSPIGSPQPLTRVQKLQATAQMDLSTRDAGGLPNGTIISGIDSPDANVANDAVDSAGSSYLGGIANLVPSRDSNIHLVGDEDAPSDLPRNERHQRGVRAAIAMHIARGFEVAADGPRLVDVPGFPKPRYYDYIIRDPVTGRHYGVEVKTTLYDTIRFDREQVMKDAVVVAQGAKVRLLGVQLSGVSYVAYCFGCTELDVRSLVLQRILQNAGCQ
jgi:hypothetical protein